MFVLDEHCQTYWFNPVPLEDLDREYCLIGILLGLAIYNDVILDVHFPAVLYRKLVGKLGTYEDLKDARPVSIWLGHFWLFHQLKKLWTLLQHARFNFQHYSVICELQNVDFLSPDKASQKLLFATKVDPCSLNNFVLTANSNIEDVTIFAWSLPLGSVTKACRYQVVSLCCLPFGRAAVLCWLLVRCILRLLVSKHLLVINYLPQAVLAVQLYLWTSIFSDNTDHYRTHHITHGVQKPNLLPWWFSYASA